MKNLHVWFSLLAGALTLGVVTAWPGRGVAATGHMRASGAGQVVSALPEDQIEPAVAYNETRQEYLVVWWNNRPGNDDIYAQRVNAEGQPEGPWFAVAWGDGLEQRTPDVAWNSARNEYLVVWTQSDHIRARRVGPTGLLLGHEIDVDAGAVLDGSGPAVAYSPTSDLYYVAWQYLRVVGGYIDYAAVRGRVLASDGQPVGNIVPISDAPAHHTTWAPEMAYNRSRNEYLVVWQQFDGLSGDDDVYGRLVAADGAVLGPGSIAIADSPVAELFPSVGALATVPQEGGYLVTWRQLGTAPQTRAQRLSGGGGLLGSSLVLETHIDSEFGPAAVAGNPGSDNYLVVWRHSYTEPYFVRELHVQRFTREGGLEGPQLLVFGTYPDWPDVVAGSTETYFVVYQHGAGSNRDIWGQLFASGAGPGDTPTPSQTPMPSPTASASRTLTPSPTDSPTWTPTASPTVSPSATISPGPSPTAGSHRVYLPVIRQP